MAASVQDSQQDNFDVFVNFTQQDTRNFFKTIHHFGLDWVNFFSKSENVGIKNGLKSFSSAFEAFNMLDLVQNLNTFRHHVFGAAKERIWLVASDLTNNICETINWIDAAKIVTLSAGVSDLVSIGSGLTLAYSFARRSLDTIRDIRHLDVNDTSQKKIKFLDLAKNIALFAIGVLVFTSTFFAFTVVAPTMLLLSTTALVSTIAKLYIKPPSQNQNE